MDENREKVALLRSQGLTPKQIAVRLGLQPAAVTQIVRSQAAERNSSSPSLPPAVGCFVNAGWSAGLSFKGEAVAWRNLNDSEVAAHLEGLVCVLLGREHRYNNVSVCGYLVDVYCLGVKDALGPRTMTRQEFEAFVPYYFSVYAGPPTPAPVELAQHLVHGAVDYARALGFDPCRDFERARSHLGDRSAPSPITFGRNGRPCFINGPRDDADRVVATLRRSVGEGGFDFILGMP